MGFIPLTPRLPRGTLCEDLGGGRGGRSMVGLGVVGVGGGANTSNYWVSFLLPLEKARKSMENQSELPSSQGENKKRWACEGAQ